MTRTQSILFAIVFLWLVFIGLIVTFRSKQLRPADETGKTLVISVSQSASANLNLDVADPHLPFETSSARADVPKPTTAPKYRFTTDDVVRQIDALLSEGEPDIVKKQIYVPPPAPRTVTSGDYMSFEKLTAENVMPWSSFARSPVQPLSINSSYRSIITQQLLKCPSSIDSALRKKLSSDELQWCQWALSSSGGRVVVGKSYGSLGSADRNKYEQLGCNNVARGENPSCDDSWGDQFLYSWKGNRVKGLCESSSSTITCKDSPSHARMCTFDNALLDLSKMSTVHRGGRSDSRKWEKGFLSADCPVETETRLDYYPFFTSMSSSMQATCTHTLNATVLLYSHDDIRNLGHSLSDFMNVWAMLWLSGMGQKEKNVVFFNIDAIREGHNYGDDLGRFAAHYERQFGQVLRASDYPANAKLCVKQLIFMPRPVLLFTWDGWWADMRCSFVGPSSLFQRYNLQVRANYDTLHPSSLSVLFLPSTYFPSDDANKVRVLLIKRTGTGAAMYTSRIIQNMDALSASLSALSSVSLAVVDLALLSLAEQMKLIASAGLIVGVHGAGIPSAMHMSIGNHRCCGVIEIFPQGEFSAIRGYGNMARRMGLHYERLDLSAAQSKSNGAVVPADRLTQLVDQSIQKILKAPSCVLPSVIDDPFFEGNAAAQ